MNKEQIVAKLKSGICEFTFTKVNGDTRNAVGTLHPEHLPPVSESAGGGAKRKPNDSIVVYYDTEANGWRSFKVAGLVSFN